MKKVITQTDILNAKHKVIHIDKDTIITPAARELADRLNVEIKEKVAIQESVQEKVHDPHILAAKALQVLESEEVKGCQQCYVEKPKVVITALGKDKVGIMAKITSVLARYQVSIVDISQKILRGFFTMMMIVDVENCTVSFEELTQKLVEAGKEIGIVIHTQHEDIFHYMHRI